MKKTLFSAIIPVILLTAGLALAQPEPMTPMEPPSPPSPPGCGMMCGPGGGMMGEAGCGMMGPLAELKLTDNQRVEIDKLKLEHQKEMMEPRSEIMALCNKLKLRITSDKFNQSEVDDITGKLSKLQQKQMQMHVKHMQAMRELLTPEQRLIFDSYVLSCKMGQGMGKGPGMMMGPRGRCQGGHGRPW